MSTSGRWRGDLVALVALLGVVNVLTGVLLDGWHSWLLHLAAAGLAVGAARRRGYTLSSLGLDPADVPAGLRLGGLVAAAIGAGVAILAALPTSSAFDDERFVDLSTAEVIFEVCFRIPIVTALTEELLFRSVLLAVLLAALTRWSAILVSSLLFGLWHVLTTLGDLGANDVTDGLSGWGVAASTLGVVAATAAAGVGFCLLRLRSGSVVAPWLAHTAINASTFLAGVIVAG